jgi:hypothetical protein
MILVSEEELRRLAEEFGPSSAEAQVLAQLASQRAQDLLKLTQFRGHPTFWVEGVHDVEAKATLPT